MTASSRLALFTRFPEPGKAKTRLIAALGADGAAQLHRRLTERALAAIKAARIPFEVRTTGAPAAAFRAWLGDLDFIDQGGGDLGARMARVMTKGPALIVGSDVPGMNAVHLLRGAELLGQHDVVIGPATDGGYWLIGMRRLVPELFADMPWGTPDVLAETRRRARILGIDLAETETLDDLDVPEDLAKWPELAP